MQCFQLPTSCMLKSVCACVCASETKFMSKAMARTLGTAGQPCVRRVSSSRCASHSNSTTMQSNADFIPQSAVDASGQPCIRRASSGRTASHSNSTTTQSSADFVSQSAVDASGLSRVQYIGEPCEGGKCGWNLHVSWAGRGICINQK